MTLRVAMYSSPLRAISKPTGVGLHVARMADGLARSERLDLSLFATRWDYEQVRPHLSPRLAALRVHYLPAAERFVRTTLIATRLLSMERWCGRVDWVYSPKEQPVATRRAKLAVTVHDLLAFEPHVPGLERKSSRLASVRWRFLMRRIVERADLIAVVSEFTRSRLLELFPMRDDGRVVVIANGVSECYFSARHEGDVAALERLGLVRDRYFVTVGSLTFRKGGDLLLKLAIELHRRRSDRRIVVTGRRHDEELLARYVQLQRDIPGLPLDLTGYVSNEDQAVIVRNALALAFPSRYEGFGIPVLEAMAAGTPVVCSRAAALPEVAGDAALFVDGDDVIEWLEQLESPSGNGARRAALIDAGRRRAAQFSWDRSTSRLVSALAERS